LSITHSSIQSTFIHSFIHSSIQLYNKRGQKVETHCSSERQSRTPQRMSGRATPTSQRCRGGRGAAMWRWSSRLRVREAPRPYVRPYHPHANRDAGATLSRQGSSRAKLSTFTEPVRETQATTRSSQVMKRCRATSVKQRLGQKS
jgi:hypothetical protein